MLPAIRVENLSKRYDLGLTHAGSIRELVGRATDRLFRRRRELLPREAAKFRDNSGQIDEQGAFWAIKDVSFDVQPGEVLGIIGRNGAGKSTILKILSRITPPTGGRIEINGRVASLLEVGTGFHPELTGRENVYLNGAILGMTKGEIRRKFDEIVAFAEIEKFIDTPVKRYSSGMYVRLAFAVAAHLDPEVLVIDEVLAVGDAEFQKRCLKKVGEVATGGRTVLFVSHNMSAVESICQRVLVVRDGKIADCGTNVHAIVNNYLFTEMDSNLASSWARKSAAYDHPSFAPLRFAVTDDQGRTLTNSQRNDAVTWIEVEGNVSTVDPALNIGYAIYNEEGLLIYWSAFRDDPRWSDGSCPSGRVRFRSRLPNRFLNEGDYRVDMIAALHFRHWMTEPGVDAPSIRFTIRGGLSDSPYWLGRRPGIAAPDLAWEAEACQ